MIMLLNLRDYKKIEEHRAGAAVLYLPTSNIQEGYRAAFENRASVVQVIIVCKLIDLDDGSEATTTPEGNHLKKDFFNQESPCVDGKPSLPVVWSAWSAVRMCAARCRPEAQAVEPARPDAAGKAGCRGGERAGERGGKHRGKELDDGEGGRRAAPHSVQ